MDVFVFGIGGTGARILRSLSFCLAANMGNLPNDTTFVPMIIDHDETNGDKALCLEIMKKYRDIRRKAFGNFEFPKSEDNFRCFFKPELRYLSELSLNNNDPVPEIDGFEFKFGQKKGTTRTFSEYLDYPTLNGEKSPSQLLLSALYNDTPSTLEMTDEHGKAKDNPLAELHLNLAVGFRGNPNIGTVVFDTIGTNNAFQLFTRMVNPDRDCVVIVGSIFGGTGSSGIPKLIEAIRTHSSLNIRNLKVAALIVQPYFKVNTPTDREAAIHDNIFKSKQKAALSYYNSSVIGNKNLNGCFDSIYYVAEDNGLQTTYEYSEGKETQLNPANIVELIGATGIIDFVKKVNQNAYLDHTNEYGFKNDGEAGHAVTLCDLYNVDDDYWKALTRFSVAMKYYKDHLLNNGIPQTTAYFSVMNLREKLGSGMYAELGEFVEYFTEWLDQLSTAKHKFSPFDMKSPNLTQMIKEYLPDVGGLFSTGVSYKDFDSVANKNYNSILNAVSSNNIDLSFLKLLFESSSKEVDMALKKPIKK